MTPADKQMEIMGQQIVLTLVITVGITLFAAVLLVPPLYRAGWSVGAVGCVGFFIGGTIGATCWCLLVGR